MRQIIQSKLFCLIFSSIFLCNITSVECWANSLYKSNPSNNVFSPLMVRNYKGSLRNKGYDVNDVNDIKKATNDTSRFVRDRARSLLAYKIGSEAIPIIKQGLDETYPTNRCTAARLLGILGDQSGLEKIRRDIEELTREYTEKEKAEINSKIARREMPLFMRSKGMRLFYALGAAQVLAEFGDSSVYDLAVKVAWGKSVFMRTQAIFILSELGRIDKATVQALGRDPEPILIALAESETDKHALDCISSSVMTCMRPDAVVRILEKLKISPHLTDQQRKITESGLRRFKKLLEQEKQGQTEKKEKETIVDNGGVTEKGK